MEEDFGTFEFGVYYYSAGEEWPHFVHLCWLRLPMIPLLAKIN